MRRETFSGHSGNSTVDMTYFSRIICLIGKGKIESRGGEEIFLGCNAGSEWRSRRSPSAHRRYEGDFITFVQGDIVFGIRVVHRDH